jgi:enamine deaminase RidA (YjgF/YER057c/UK114 family)
MIERFQTNHRMSQAVVFDASSRVAILSGPVSKLPDASTGEQTKDVLSRISTLLKEVGASEKSVVSATIWLTDIADFEEMNAVWDQWVPQGHAPARATVEAKLANPALKVEIQVTALIETGGANQ